METNLNLCVKESETEKVKLFEVCNNMMMPSLQVGSCIVGINITGSSFIQWGEIHVLIIDGLNHQCRIYPSDKDDYYKVKYDNNDYPVNYVPKSYVSKIYLVKGIMTLL